MKPTPCTMISGNAMSALGVIERLLLQPHIPLTAQSDLALVRVYLRDIQRHAAEGRERELRMRR